MRKEFMAHLHASLESTCKRRITRISTRCHNQEGKFNHLSTTDPELRNVSFPLISFMGFSAILSPLQPFQICIYKGKYSKLTFSNGYQLMRKEFMAHLHASLEIICKSGISKISTRFHNQGGKIIFKLLILNSEMKVLHSYLLWGFLLY